MGVARGGGLSILPADPGEPDDVVTREEQEITDLVADLRDAGSLQPLVARLCSGAVGPDRGREVLHVLGEYDLGLLVRLTVHALTSEPGGDQSPARQSGGA